MFRACAFLLLLTACSDQREIPDELPNSSLAGAPREEVSESRMDAPVARAVTIGEDGPRLAACGGLGQVIQTGANGLPMRAAPFSDAKELARLPEGSRAFLCTRSIDQRWLGIVVAPPAGKDEAPTDCGILSPVERRQPYDGPCPSGWVSSSYIRLVGG